MFPTIRSQCSVAAVAQAAPQGVVVAHWRCWWVVAGVGAVGAQRSPLGWAMGSSQRLAAVAAVSNARHYYNHSQPDTVQTESMHYTINIFVSATLCGVLVAVCAACWRRSPSSDKPEEVAECHGVYTVSGDSRLAQMQMELPGAPPAYETVVEGAFHNKNCDMLQEVVTEGCPRCHSGKSDEELPSYEAAVLLKDTKL
ncbi:hypothetical protein K1T71_010139 [Dendrolimus kikuchii]|uniref:Uncharacterized protein n=1 Tax=Dendrolimus kikuchii TaxID=765133 RepID=A0ACC1CQT8_9NEOP|nr:hypothetical protein K1T71_010139 [Dendrolimus kikuchii]